MAETQPDLLDKPAAGLDRRIRHLVGNADFSVVASALEQQREVILDRWLRQATRQPFHAEHPDLAVADHIPQLFDAVILVLRRAVHEEGDAPAPLDDERVAAAARSHADNRFKQGLGPVAIATEFRLLRQEISGSIKDCADDSADVSDLIGSMMIVSDALDGATSLALSALTERVESVREEFMATTVHDVRQPITLIEASLVLAARSLRRKPLDEGRIRETVDAALIATQEMSLVVDTMADVSRSALGRMELNPEPTILRSVIKDATGVLNPDARARVVVDGGLDRAIVGNWDATALRRVLANLITNAAKYSPPGSTIRIAATATGEAVHITVSDEGIGLEPDEIANLFERYSRAPSARGLPGLGLGLYAARAIVEAHGGRIWLESPGRGQGTIAHIILPIAPDDEGDAQD